MKNAFFVFLLFVSIKSNAQNPVDWKWIVDSGSGDKFYQQFTHKRIADDVVDVWDRTNFKSYKVTAKGKNVYKTGVYQISLTRYDCTDKKYRTLQGSTYDSRGNVIGSFDSEYGSMSYATPGSVVEALLENACKMIGK